jgi:hypothetical protein
MGLETCRLESPLLLLCCVGLRRSVVASSRGPVLAALVEVAVVVVTWPGRR